MKALWQISAILFIALIIGTGYNQFRGDGLPLLSTLGDEPPARGEFDKISTISIDEAARLFKNKGAVFLDARPAELYKKGHIKGALNLPWENAEEQCFEVIDKIPQDKKIITYCDGPTCHLCDYLAEFLMEDIGYDHVSALVNGWSTWRLHNLPVDPPVK